MARKTGQYDNLNASDLARITRDRGLDKPQVITLREWADWLEAQDHPTTVASVKDVEIIEDEMDSENVDNGRIGDYSDMSNTKLRKLAKERGITLHERTEIIDALQAADGFTEDEQQQMDNAFDGEAS